MVFDEDNDRSQRARYYGGIMHLRCILKFMRKKRGYDSDSRRETKAYLLDLVKVIEDIDAEESQREGLKTERDRT